MHEVRGSTGQWRELKSQRLGCSTLRVTHGALAGRNFPSVPHSMEESASPILHVAFALSIGQMLLLPMLELS